MVDSISRRFFDYGAAAVFKGVAALCGLGLSLVLTRSVGAQVAGYYFLFFSILSVLSVVVRTGTDNLVLRVIPRLESRSHFGEAMQYLKFVVAIVVTASTVVAGLILMFEGTLLELLHLQDEAQFFAKILIVVLPVYSVALAASFFYQAFGRAIVSISIPGIAVPVLFSTFVVVVFGMGAGQSVVLAIDPANTVLGLFGISVLLVAVPSVLGVRSRLGPASAKVARLGLDNVRRKLSESMPFFVVAVMSVLSLNVGNLAAGVFLSATEVSYLAVSTKVATSIALILTAVNAVAAPQFSKLHSAGDTEELRRVFLETRNLTLIVGAIPFMLVLVFAREILWLFGDEFQAATKILIIVSVGQFINAATGPVTYLLQMTGCETEFMRWTVVVSLLTVIGTFVLTMMFGLTGAAVAVTTSVVVLNVGALLMTQRKLGFSWI